jgi:hypothetical protein
MWGYVVSKATKPIHVPTESNHGSKQKSIDNREDGPGVDKRAVAVHTAAHSG